MLTLTRFLSPYGADDEVNHPASTYGPSGSPIPDQHGIISSHVKLQSPSVPVSSRMTQSHGETSTLSTCSRTR